MDDIKPYYDKREQLSVQSECILWGLRVVVPEQFRTQMLDLLHDAHPGTVRMKAIARMHLWWPGLDSDIEQITRTCHACMQQSHMPAASPLQQWRWPRRPWERIHLDFGQKGSDYFLIVVDAHSKWIDVERMTNITSSHTISKLRQMMARYGISRELVSDNGPQLTSLEFELFLKSNGIKHILVPVYHPQSNGQAERAVQHVKESLSKMRNDAKDDYDLNHKICRFLMMQHSTPHATTGRSPSELFVGRHLRTKLSLMHMDLSTHVEEQQVRQKGQYDRKHRSTRVFDEGQEVYYRNYSQNEDKWRPGTLGMKNGNNTWLVETDHGNKVIHVDQLKSKNSEVQQVHKEMVPSHTQNPKVNQMENNVDQDTEEETSKQEGDGKAAQRFKNSCDLKIPLRRSERIVKKPDRLNL